MSQGSHRSHGTDGTYGTHGTDAPTWKLAALGLYCDPGFWCHQTWRRACMSFGRIALVAAVFGILVPLSSPAADPEWIWLNDQPASDEVAHFRKTFTLDGDVKSAILAIACDDE